MGCSARTWERGDPWCREHVCPHAIPKHKMECTPAPRSRAVLRALFAACGGGSMSGKVKQAGASGPPLCVSLVTIHGGVVFVHGVREEMAWCARRDGVRRGPWARGAREALDRYHYGEQHPAKWLAHGEPSRDGTSRFNYPSCLFWPIAWREIGRRLRLGGQSDPR